MKYERLTERVGKGISVKETSTSDNRSIWNAIVRLAELEDKIERGELVDVKENHLIAISRGSGKSFKRLEAMEILTKYEQGMLVEKGYHIRKSYRNHDDQRYKITLVVEHEIEKIGFDGLTKAEAEQKLKELEE